MPTQNDCYDDTVKLGVRLANLRWADGCASGVETDGGILSVPSTTQLLA